MRIVVSAHPVHGNLNRVHLRRPAESNEESLAQEIGCPLSGLTIRHTIAWDRCRRRPERLPQEGAIAARMRDSPGNQSTMSVLKAAIKAIARRSWVKPEALTAGPSR